MIKVCGICCREFEAKNHSRAYCSEECVKEAKKRSRIEFGIREKAKKLRKAPPPAKSIADVMAYAEECRKRLGRYVSYGEAVALMDGRV